MRNKLLLAGLVALAALGIACGSGSGDTTGSVDGSAPSAGADDGPVTAAIGQTVTLTNSLLGSTDKVEVTLANPQQFTEDPESSGFLKPDNGIYLVLDATVVCDEGTYLASPFSFTFVGADGTAYDTAITVGFKPGLDTINLNPGQRTAGTVVFDVPQAALAGAKIQIDGIGLDVNEGAAYWAL
jgi:hypothetical protein